MIQQIIIRDIVSPKRAVLISSAPYISMKKVTYLAGRFADKVPIRLAKNLLIGTEGFFWKLGKGSKEYSANFKMRTLKKSSQRALVETAIHLLFEYNISSKKINFPCLFVAGLQDKRVDPKAAKKLTKIFLNSKVLHIPEADHSNVIRLLATKYKSILINYIS